MSRYQMSWIGCLLGFWLVWVQPAHFAAGPQKQKPHLDQYGEPLPEGALARLGSTRFGFAAGIEKVAWSPDGKILAAGGGGTIRFWDPGTGKPIWAWDDWERHTGSITGISWSPDGKILATSAGGKIFLWKPEKGKEIPELKEIRVFSYNFLIRNFKWSPDGKTLALAAWPGHSIRLCDSFTGKEIGICQRVDDDGPFSWCPTGKILALAGNDHSLRLWEPGTGKIRSRKGYEDSLFAVTWSPDGKILASAADRDKTIRFWDPATGQEFRTCMGHEDRVYEIAWSPDGKTLASAGQETIRLWDSAMAKEICRYTNNKCSFHSIAFSPDGRQLASVTSDSIALIWKVPTITFEKRHIAQADLDRLWLEFGSGDAKKAFQAIGMLVAAQDRAVEFIHSRLQIPKASPERIQQLIGDLGHDAFAIRNKASKELGQLGAQAVPALQNACKTQPLLEVKVRIRQLLKRVDNQNWPSMPLSWWRGLAVLERIGTPRAQEALADLARTSPDTRLAEEAAAALGRLQKVRR